MTLFFASDHHFHHTKLVEGFGDEKRTEHVDNSYRPFSTIEEHDEKLIEYHNETVTDKDEVYFAGDLFLSGRYGEGVFDYTLLGRLKGKKKLVVGNHDTSAKIKEYAQYFSHIVGYAEIGSLFLSHVPIHTSQFDTRFKGNIHGHVHKDTIPDDRYFNISLENINYRPVSLDEIKKHFKDKGIL